MKAAVLTHHRQPLEIHDVPMPTPGPGDAVYSRRGMRRLPQRIGTSGRKSGHGWISDFSSHEFSATSFRRNGEEVGREVGTSSLAIA
jgi:hypothetical protein